MALLLCVLFFLISSMNACCVYESKVKYFRKSSGLSAGACGYGSAVTSYYGRHLAAATPSIYKSGAGCGSCFQIRCTDKKLCKKQGVKVTVTDINRDNATDFVLSSIALRAMANKGMDKSLLHRGIVPVEYKRASPVGYQGEFKKGSTTGVKFLDTLRVNCDFKTKNFSVRVEESSKKNYLAVKFLYQGGKTEILVVEAAKGGSPNWISFRKNYGAVWDTSSAPTGPLLFRIAVLGGYDAKWVYTKTPVPAARKTGMIYNTGMQISDNAMDGCSPCDDGSWS